MKNLVDLNTDIFKELGLENISENEKVELLLEMAKTVQMRISDRVINQLTEADQKKLDELMAKNDDIAIDEFLTAKVPNIDDIAMEELVKFKQEMADEVKALREKVAAAMA